MRERAVTEAPEETSQRVHFAEAAHVLGEATYGGAADAPLAAPDSVTLVVTSPPYPMIEMWDADFAWGAPEISEALASERGHQAFELMHGQLDSVWARCYDVLTPGGFLCVNIGDATRTIGGQFQMYPNHARIVESCRRIGFSVLPAIIWRKQTNAPNKFMGSGMLPAGAYVTLEHEFLLVLRKGQKRAVHTAAERQRRRRSAIFWEERNQWFSDLWDLKGVRQRLAGNSARNRTAAFPLELAYRLVAMFSLQGDTVLDPFLGTGTTLVAAAALARHGIGVEREAALAPEIADGLTRVPALSQALAEDRLSAHEAFVEKRRTTHGELKHWNAALGRPVVTGQETELQVPRARQIEQIAPSEWRVRYAP